MNNKVVLSDGKYLNNQIKCGQVNQNCNGDNKIEDCWFHATEKG